MIDKLNKPIPGQSLTSKPKGHPYERPPEITDPEEAIQMHLLRLSDKEMTDDILNTLETFKDEVSVKTLTQGILRSAVAAGIHSIDVSLIIAPVVHAYIKSTADMAGIDYDEGLVDKEAEADKEKALAKAKLLKAFRDMEDAPEFLSEAKSEEGTETKEEVTKEPTERPEVSGGFMQRRNT